MSETPEVPETPEMPEVADLPDRLRGLPSRLLALTSARADRVVSERLAAEDARKWHYAALASLAEYGPTSQAGLSRRTGIYRSDLVAVMNELEAQGHVARTPDPADRRRNVVTITSQGRQHLRRLDKILADAQDELMAPLSVAERSLLVSLLERMLAR
ncbi:MarR family winged helix-turn-helix transcriptional regulator [Streptomyces sp. NPDC101160]|uniref:MarR family winged helix-turn-helix transcriptional regulator n=1 Tax=Streptomyces sp. NPDC101160 TaxID=3366118 RepID=UPI00382FE5A2